jgi:hypothetical protein
MNVNVMSHGTVHSVALRSRLTACAVAVVMQMLRRAPQHQCDDVSRVEHEGVLLGRDAGPDTGERPAPFRRSLADGGAHVLSAVCFVDADKTFQVRHGSGRR